MNVSDLIERLQRQVKVFPVLETELSIISYMNIISTLCFSVGGYFFDKVLDIQKNKIDYESQFFMISIFLFIVGSVSIGIRWNAIHKIKKQSKF